MRIALKIAYIGTDYHGFQVQPDVRTIEGELFRALEELKIINSPKEANYMASGRTDKGVHALCQVVAFDTDNPNAAIPRAINSRLNNIWSWASAHVAQDFHPRRDARYREYRYIMHGKYATSTLRKAAKLLKGKHDFSNFATPEKGRTTVCRIERVKIQAKKEFTIIDIRADRFLWHMVRKLATALKKIGTGAKDLKWLENMLSLECSEALEPAPAFGLILKNVEYANVKWNEDAYAKRAMLENIEEQFLWHATMSELLRGFYASRI